MVFKLIWILLKEKPDILHTHTPKAGLLGMLAGWIIRVPIRIHTVAGMPLMGLSGIKFAVVRFTEKLTYFCANQVWPNSNGLMEWIKNQKLCPSQKMKVIGHGASNGVNIKLFDPAIEDIQKRGAKLRQQMNIGQEDIVLLFVGRIAKEKGICELESAFREVQTLLFHG